MNIGITGRRSAIAQEFLKFLSPEDKVIYGTAQDLPLDLDQYFLCAGVIVGKNIVDIDESEACDMLRVNFVDVVKLCEKIFKVNPKARICIVGSESGFKGSFDIVYAASKAGVHLYVESKRLQHASQHLVCVAPTIIEDTGMTRRRGDVEETMRRGKERRLGRWLRAQEVARTCHFVLSEDALCNTVVRMTGGNW
ncbi:MAG: family oxidoreductase [Patescibacteria group bacterium]|jgi:NAD(P)-dependent dehydrogenase (short-subunit alcohol dehydrogenase family)|nr:family oxidoreductase [Patescibacteria group bacterium]